LSGGGQNALDAVSVDPSDMLSDLHGTAAYRTNLVKARTKRAAAKPA
jgi:aerobic carbon-monoxide dehydrogenase medium subunit